MPSLSSPAPSPPPIGYYSELLPDPRLTDGRPTRPPWLQAFYSIRVWCLVCLITAGLLAWSSRKSMNPDGMSYLDMASETVHGGPANLVNGYWSPLYPGIVSLAIWLFRPSPEQEFPLVHLVNWVIFVAVMLSFLFFLRTWLEPDTPESRDQQSVGKHFVSLGFVSLHLVPLGFVVFLTAATQLIPLWLVTPDLCVCGCVLLSAGLCRRLSGAPSMRGYAALGVVLGLSYYAKAAMLPIGLMLLAILGIWPLSRPALRLRFLGTACVAFLITCAPLIALISQRQGRFSVGETGKLNYAWYVDHLEPASQGWEGEGALHGAPTHPPRILMEHPRVLEFGFPIRGTYPLWFDPSYWYAGARTSLQPFELLRNLFENLRHCGPMASVFLGALALLAGVLAKGKVAFVPESSVWLVVWPVAVCCMYAVVHIENRFIGGFVAVFWLGIYGLYGVKVKHRAQALLPAAVAVLFLAFAVRNLGRNLAGPATGDAGLVAARLGALGARPGDRIAVVGDGLYAFYARLARVQIVAEIPNTDDSWQADCRRAEALEQRLRNAGVTFLVASNRPVSYRCAGWQEIPGASGLPHSVLPLNVLPHEEFSITRASRREEH